MPCSLYGRNKFPPRKKAVIIAPKLKQLEPLVADQIEVEEDSCVNDLG